LNQKGYPNLPETNVQAGLYCLTHYDTWISSPIISLLCAAAWSRKQTTLQAIATNYGEASQLASTGVTVLYPLTRLDTFALLLRLTTT